MKNKFFLLPFLILLAVAGCKKDTNNQVTYTGGTNPVLVSSYTSSNALVLDSTNAAKTNAMTFSWTNPSYQFSNGVSSQDVSYTLQVDTSGSNFTNPSIQEVSISKDLAKTFTVKELNTVLTKLGVAENISHTISFRLKSTIGGAVPLYSNVINTKIVPYLDVAVPLPPTGDLYITGDAMPSGWTNAPPNTQKMTPVASSRTSTGLYTSYTITVTLAPGLQYKFLSTPNFWQPQYGGSSATGGDLGYNMGGGSDPAAIPTPSAGGSYKITVNFRSGTYTVEKQ